MNESVSPIPGGTCCRILPTAAGPLRQSFDGAQDRPFDGAQGRPPGGRGVDGDWGCKLEDISIPVHVWQGTADTMVPYPLGEHLAKTIPKAILHKLPDEGHFFPVTHMDEIMEVARSAMTITIGAGRS